MTAQGQACCSSPGAMCYWCVISFLAWGVLSIIGVWWYPLHSSSAATICLAVAIGCFVNWLRNRTLHCAITGPLFLVAGVVFLLSALGAFAIHPGIIWPILGILTGIAFLLEWRYKRGSSC
jgi:hypothetical protein